MSAPAQNKNAEKWTLERTLQILDLIESYSYSSDCLYLGHALDLANVYNDVWAYWKRKWKRNPIIIAKMKSIMQKFEARIFNKMASKEIPANVAMFVLRHHHHWGKEEDPGDYEELSMEDRLPTPEQEAEAKEALAPKPKKDPPSGMAYNRYKLDEYNQAHPKDPILPPVYYFEGTPQPGVEATLYDGGYFVRGSL